LSTAASWRRIRAIARPSPRCAAASAGRSLARVARWGAGFLAGGPPNHLEHLIKEVLGYWREAGVVTTPKLLRTVLAQYGQLGVDEVICYCWGRGVDQIDRICDAL
jgi:hypothetical protein